LIGEGLKTDGVYWLKWIFATHFKLNLVEKKKIVTWGPPSKPIKLAPKPNYKKNHRLLINKANQSITTIEPFIHLFWWVQSSEPPSVWIILHVKCILERRVQGLGYP
jgi:hypothetical protein